MKWSIQVGRFAGIDVFMHFTFSMLISWVALTYWRQGQSVAAALTGVFFILVVFICVVLDAIKALQRIERIIVRKKRELLGFRNQLHRALGGSV